MEKKKAACAYIRVSTEYQTEYSPESQLKLIKNFAENNNYTLTEVYSDEGISGRQAEKRPAFKKMLLDAQHKSFETILIYNTSRFARNHEESIVYRNMLKREGIDVVSITQPSVDYKTDILMNALYAVMDERYSIELSENVKRGMKEKVSRGLYISCAPLGYTRTVKNHPLEINENEALLIQWIFDAYLKGESLLSIARELNEKGHRGKKGGLFGRRDIYRILTNVTYKGYLKWTCDGNEMIIKADHQPLIEENIFEKVQTILENSSSKRITHRKDSAVSTHWLSGLIRCPVCGSTYIFCQGYGKRDSRFRCGRYGSGICTHSKSIGVKTMENLVLDYFKLLPFSEVDYYKTNPHPPASDNFQICLEKLDKALERAKKAYLAGIDTLSEYELNKDIIRTEILEIKEKINQENKSSEITNEKSKNLIQIKILAELLTSDRPASEKNKALKSIIDQIIIDHDNKTLSFYFYA